MGPLETTVQHRQAHSYGPHLRAGISGLLFGYDTGVISSTLVSIGEDLGHPLTTLDKSLITSCTSLSALIASPLAALLADRIGRKPIVLIADVCFITGALCQSVITSVSGMVVGRSIVGFAVARWWSKPRGPAVYLQALACSFPGETGHFEHIIHRYWPGDCLRYRVRSVYAEEWLEVDGGLRACAGGAAAYIDARVTGESKVVGEGRQVTTSSRHSSESLRRWERRRCGGGTACHQHRDCGGRSHK